MLKRSKIVSGILSGMLIASLLLAVGSFVMLEAQEPLDAEPTIPVRAESTADRAVATLQHILHDSQLVFSNAIRREHKFNQLVQGIPALNTMVEFRLYETQAPAYEILIYYAEYFSINPFVVLSLLEMENDILNSDNLTEEELRHIAGIMDSQYEGFDKQIEWLTWQLFEHYYGYKYNQSFSIPVVSNLNAGTFAVQSVLALVSGEATLDLSKLPERGNRFVAVYQQFRDPSEDVWWKPPTDEGRRTTGKAKMALAQPYMLLPWAYGESWHFTGGPHNFNGTCCNRPWSSLDYAPQGSAGCGWTSYSPVKAARSGTVSYSGYAHVKVDHQQEIWEEPWTTSYFHLRSRPVRQGDNVNVNSTLGYPSCSGGTSTGVHLHFSFIYDGQFTEAHGKYLSSWLVQETSHYNGTMSKGGQVVTADSAKSAANLVAR